MHKPNDQRACARIPSPLHPIQPTPQTAGAEEEADHGVEEETSPSSTTNNNGNNNAGEEEKETAGSAAAAVAASAPAAMPHGLAANEGILSTEEVNGGVCVCGVRIIGVKSLTHSHTHTHVSVCISIYIHTHSAARPRHAAPGGRAGPPLRGVSSNSESMLHILHHGVT